jgi:hypothetical protein
MLYLVGLGLADETDITVKGLAIVKRVARVYLEAYTSILLVDKEKLVTCPPSICCSCMKIPFSKTVDIVGSLLWTFCDSGRQRDG